jgi:HD-GYP domain-containing protein (c-di-GMP phosphodiesterase class II)
MTAIYIRRMWNFSKALDLALVDEEIEKSFEVTVGQRHGERVGYIALRLGRNLGLNQKQLVQLLTAGLMHDIGAVGGFHQFHGDTRLAREHCLLGANIVQRFQDGEILSEAIRYHHETPDPKYSALGADESDVPLLAKIISLADKVDVNLSRSHMKYSERKSLIHWVIAHEGTMFYPEIIPSFIEIANTDAFWLDLMETDLLQVALAYLSDMGNLPKSSSLNSKFARELALTFADLIDQKSDFTARHSRSVADIVEQLAWGMRWDKKDISEIRVAGLLHDLGKLSVPKKVLDKPGKLGGDEIEVIRTHTYHTHRLLNGAGFPHNIVRWAAFHHERLDGRGYPFGIKADGLDEGARLMTIADIFTALTEDRPYRNALSSTEALDIIAKGSGTQVDSKLVDVARRVLG